MKQVPVWRYLSRSGGVLAAAALVMATALAACGAQAAAPASSQAAAPASSQAAAPASSQATRVAVTLKEMSIALNQASAPAGTVVFTVKNAGQMEHEMVLLKTDIAQDKVPPRPNDGSKVQETGNGIEDLGEVEALAAGTSKDLTLQLKPGKYVLICNVAGHYAAGMHAAFTVQ
ncbi:MAG: cupredoxin domain-containing protein [Chloroflexota bacterium]